MEQKPRPKSAAPKRPISAFGPTKNLLAEKQNRAQSAPVKNLGSLPEKLPPPTRATEHKRYTSVYPCSSKLLAKKWDDAARQKHIDKLKTMKAGIDNSTPTKPLHLVLGRVKNMKEQEKRKRIERENHLLLERMAKTWNQPMTKFALIYQKTVDDLEHKSKAHLRQRQQAQEKIKQENLLLLQRVQSKRPQYESKQWIADREQHLRILKNISRFPEIYNPKMIKETA